MGARSGGCDGIVFVLDCSPDVDPGHQVQLRGEEADVDKYLGAVLNSVTDFLSLTLDVIHAITGGP